MALATFAIVTGAGSGIGKECAFQFAEHGAAGVLFADINDKAAQEAAEKSKEFATAANYKAVAVKVDVSEESSVNAMVEEAVKSFGRIDSLVNCAGIASDSVEPVAQMPIESLDKMYRVNMRGTFLCVSAVSKVMLQQDERKVTGRSGERSIGRGSIVNIASLTAYVPVPTHSPYCSTKAGVLSITKVAAAEMAAHGVRVNAVCPGWVKTPMMEGVVDKVGEGLREMITKGVPMGRMAYAEEVANLLRFLCGPEASYITGVGYIIDAGASLTSAT